MPITRWRCTACDEVVDESQLVDGKVLRNVADIRADREALGLPADPLVTLTPEQWATLETVDTLALSYRDAKMHTRHRSIGSGRPGVIGCRLERFECGPVEVETVDPYVDALEHWLGTGPI